MHPLNTLRSPMNAAELAHVLSLHGKWIRLEPEGVRADLRGADLSDADLRGAYLRDADLRDADLRGANLSDADLRGANLSGADLRDADLSDADLRGANLSGADLSDADLRGAYLRGAYLRGADLRGAYLRGAYLRDADLSDVKEDLFNVLDNAPTEVSGLLAALRDGKIDGSTYTGPCACLIGTIAHVRGCDYSDIPNIQPDADRPAERWFLAIWPGHTPETSQVAKITEGWIVEWLAAHPMPVAPEASLAAPSVTP